MNQDIQFYNDSQVQNDKVICDLLSAEICDGLQNAENKIWHGHPVWFIDGNPIVGYSKLKDCIQLLFWSGQSFEEETLPNAGSFKAAEVRYTSITQINIKDLRRWLKKSIEIQWNYKDLIKLKSLEPLKGIFKEKAIKTKSTK